MIELESVKTRISAPARPSEIGIGRVSGLVTFHNPVLMKYSTVYFRRVQTVLIATVATVNLIFLYFWK